MRTFSLLTLAIAIVALSAATSKATIHAKSNNGSEITWVSGYPKATKGVGLMPPIVKVKFTVSPASGWTPTQVSYYINRYSAEGGYNGNQLEGFTENFSEEHSHAVPGAGKTAKVVDIYLTVMSGGNSEQATEADSGSIVIRD